MTIRLYGFRSCDMVRNARKWLDARGVSHDFVDYRREALAPETIDDWFARAGWEQVFNRNSATFRALPANDTVGLDEGRARELILAETNLIRRPVLDTGDTLSFGFNAEAWTAALGVSATRSQQG